MPRPSKTEKNEGTYTNEQGKTIEAHVLWVSEKGGFVLYSTKGRKAISDNGYPTLVALKEAGFDFTMKSAEKTVEPVAA